MRYNVPGRRMGAGVGQRLPNHEERGRLGQQQGNQTTGGYQHGNRSSHGNRSHHSQRSQFVNNSPGSGSHDLYSTSTGEPWYKYKTRPPITNDEKIKSEMCRNLQENGNCPYGTGCRFAHHESELRKILRHPKHKTQLCRDYHGNGHCTFGSRCSYIHEPKERTPSESNQLNTTNFGLDSLPTMSEVHSFTTESMVDFDVNEDYDYEQIWRQPLAQLSISLNDLQTIESMPSFLMERLLKGISSVILYNSSPPDFIDSSTTEPVSPVNYMTRRKASIDVLETPRRPLSQLACPDSADPGPVSPLHQTRCA